MATGGDPKKPSPLKTFLDQGKNLFADLRPTKMDPKARTLSTASLTQSGTGSTPNLGPTGSGKKSPKTVGTNKPGGITDVTKGQGAISKGQIPSVKPVADDIIEVEEPHLVEEVSDDDGPEVTHYDSGLLDPEEDEKVDEIHTLAAIFPKVPLKPEQLAKDPEPSLQKVIDLTGLTDQTEIEEYIQYYMDLCRHRRKIYIHAGLLVRKLIKKKNHTAEEMEDFLYYTENSKKVLLFIHAKIVDMSDNDQTSGQKRSYTCGLKNLDQSLDEIRNFLEKDKEAEQTRIDKKIRQAEAEKAKAEAEKAKAEADTAAAEAAKLKAEHEKEKALSQINALKTVRQTVSNSPVVQRPQNVRNSIPTGSGAEHSGYRPETGTDADPNNDGTTPRRYTSQGFQYGRWSSTRRGGRGGGGRTPNRGDDPPFRPSQNEDVNDLIRGLSDLLRNRSRDNDKKPNYQGIEKTKLDFFSGDASVYAHWKKKFLLAHGPERNLPDEYLANALHNLLKDEARKYVEAHFTADWTGENYHRMWEQLDLVYGSKHIQDRCIQDRAARMAPLDQDNLKTFEKFYIGVTVQINYYSEHQPEAVLIENSLLYQQMRQKISEKLFIKFIEWTIKDSSEETESPRSLMTLQAWLAERLRILREVDTFNSSSRLRSSKSPSRSNHTGTIEHAEDESDSDTDPTHSVLQIDNTGKRTLFNKSKNKVFRYKPFAGEYKSPEQLSSKRTMKPSIKSYDQSFETNDTLCPICRDVSHELSTCSKFRRLTTFKRYAIVRRSRACFHCLNRGHPMHSCEVNKGVPCGVDGCKRYENPLLHADETTKKIPYTEWNDVTHGELVWNDADGDVDESPSRSGFNTVMRLAKPGSVGIQTVVCNLSGPSQRQVMRTVAMLDSGADNTYIDEQTATDLNLKRVSEPVSAFINQFEGRVEIKTWQVEVHLTSIDGFVSQTIHAWTKKDLTDKTGVVDWDKAKRNFKHIKDVPFEKLPRDARIRILIGTENSFLFAPEEGSLHTGGRGEPNAYLCVLGWTCYGPSQKLETKLEDMVHSLMPSQIPRNK